MNIAYINERVLNTKKVTGTNEALEQQHFRHLRSNSTSRQQQQQQQQQQQRKSQLEPYIFCLNTQPRLTPIEFTNTFTFRQTCIQHVLDHDIDKTLESRRDCKNLAH